MEDMPELESVGGEESALDTIFAAGKDLEDLRSSIVSDGASKGAMVALESISEGSLPEEYPINSFTVVPSDFNVEVALESVVTSIFKGIGRAIELLLKLIGKIFVGLGKALMWLTGMSGDSSGAISAGTAIADSGKDGTPDKTYKGNVIGAKALINKDITTYIKGIVKGGNEKEHHVKFFTPYLGENAKDFDSKYAEYAKKYGSELERAMEAVKRWQKTIYPAYYSVPNEVSKSIKHLLDAGSGAASTLTEITAAVKENASDGDKLLKAQDDKNKSREKVEVYFESKHKELYEKYAGNLHVIVPWIPHNQWRVRLTMAEGGIPPIIELMRIEDRSKIEMADFQDILDGVNKVNVDTEKDNVKQCRSNIKASRIPNIDDFKSNLTSGVTDTGESVDLTKAREYVNALVQEAKNFSMMTQKLHHSVLHVSAGAIRSVRVCQKVTETLASVGTALSKGI